MLWIRSVSMRVAVSSDPGAQQPNEDQVAIGDGMLAVLDGSTSRTATGCEHGVAWFARELAVAIVREPAASPAQALSVAITHVSGLHSGCDLAHPGTPAAAVGIAAIRDGVLSYLILGDVTLLAETADGLLVLTDDRVSTTALAQRAAADALPYGSPEKASAVVAMKHAELAVRNKPGGFWVAAADPAIVTEAITGEIPLTDVRDAALLTDGAARMVDPLGLHAWPAVMELLRTAGPRELIRQVREAEDADPAAIRWPRNKIHDDATAAFLQPGEAS
jgi:hypothetical protein